MQTVPGRKTDVKDSDWLADLLRHGLLQASFIPPAPIRALRELTRYRKTLIRERVQQANRLRDGCWKAPISSWQLSPAMCSA
jgi:transposase